MQESRIPKFLGFQHSKSNTRLNHPIHIKASIDPLNKAFPLKANYFKSNTTPNHQSQTQSNTFNHKQNTFNHKHNQTNTIKYIQSTIINHKKKNIFNHKHNKKTFNHKHNQTH